MPAQTEFVTAKVDAFIEQLYQQVKPQMIDFIKNYTTEHGEQIINLRDSTGNCLIHHLCTIFEDDEVQIFKNVLSFLMRAASKNEESKEEEELAAMNFLRGVPLSLQYNKDSLQELGIGVITHNSLRTILKINLGNAFGQTPLHLLASQKKTTLLNVFLDVVFDDKLDLLGFNPNVSESTDRTFMHILLEKGQFHAFEELATKYQGWMDLTKKDMFENSILMTYKRLKRNLIDKLKREKKYKEMIDEILTANLKAFGDMRNLVFDRELGTNILSNLVTQKRGQDFICLLKELTRLNEKQLLNMGDLVNVPNTSGYSLTFIVFMRLTFRDIQTFLQTIGSQSITYLINPVNQINLLHSLLENNQLTLDQKHELVVNQLPQCRPLMKAFDFQGNYPINYLIQSLPQQTQMTIAELRAFKDLQNISEIMQDREETRENLKERYAQYIEQLKRHEEIRKVIAKKQDKYEGKKQKQIKSFVVKGLSRREIRGKQNTLKKYNEPMVKSMAGINPLEVAIQRNQKGLCKYLIEQEKISVLNYNSSFSSTIIEQSLTTSDLELFNLAVKSIQNEQIRQTLHPLSILLRIQQQAWSFDKSKLDQFKQIYDLLISKFLELDTKELIALEFLDNQDCLIVNKETDLKSLLKNKKLEESLKPMNHIDLTHLSQLLLLAVGLRSYKLLEALTSHLTFENCQDKNQYFLYRLFKESAYRNDSKLMQTLATLYPGLKDIIQNNRKYKESISKAMFITFKDIVKTDCISFMKDQLGIVIIPKLSEVKALQRQNYAHGSLLGKLSSSQQRELRKQQQAQAFKHVVELLKNRESILAEDTEDIANLFLNSKNKNQYLHQLVEQKVLFEILDIRQDSQSSAVSQFLRQSLSLGDFKTALKLMEQLKVYLRTHNSSYPLDYMAEISQFERNFPYREFKISNFIRKLNYKQDQYPIFHGQVDTEEITDDQETEYSEIWDRMLTEKNPTKTLNGQDYYVPNGNALLFKMLASERNTLISVNQENQDTVLQIFSYIFEFGGFPMIEISNIKDKNLNLTKESLQKLTKQNWLLQKFNGNIRSGKFQNLLHQIALDQNCDPIEIRRLSQNDCFIQQSFNSRDSKGFTPILLAIESKNFTFLEAAFSNNSSIFIQGNHQFIKIIQRVFKEDHYSATDKIRILKYLAQNFRSLNIKNQQLMLQSNLRGVNEMLDVIYSTGYEYQGDQMKQLAEKVVSQLQTTTKALQQNQKSILEVFKLSRAQLQQATEKGNIDTQIILSQMMTATFQTGTSILQIAGQLNLEQFKELEASGYPLCNLISAGFTIPKSLLQKVLIIQSYFPFTNNQYHISYALKYVLLCQPKNQELINYIFKQMNLNVFKPFLFEIMVLIGKILGTKNEIFKQLFIQEKAHLMGRMLTVESRLKSFNESCMPQPINQYYNGQAYEQLLINLTECLIQENELGMFIQFINDQARFFLCKSFITKGLEACCRHFRPKMALLLISLGIKEDIKNGFVDYSNLMPDLKAEVTLKDVQQTAFIVKSLDKEWSPISFFKKITREMMDELITIILDNNQLYLIFNLNEKELKNQQHELLTQIYHKVSPHLIDRLVIGLKCKFYKYDDKHVSIELCSNEKIQFRLVKMLISMPCTVTQSVSNACFSNTYKMFKRAEMMSFLKNKVEVFATDENYYEILTDETRAKELAEYLCITDNDLKEIKRQVIQIHDDHKQLENKKFVFGEFQTLMGVYKLPNASKHQNRNELNSVIEFQQMSNQEIRDLKPDELKNKSENLILLYQYLVRQDQRRSAQGQQIGKQPTLDNRDNDVITDQELRDLFYQSKPTHVNLSCMFTAHDSTIYCNDFEEFLEKQKLETVWLQHIQSQLKDLSRAQLNKMSRIMGAESCYSNQGQRFKNRNWLIVLPYLTEMWNFEFELSVKELREIQDAEERERIENDLYATWINILERMMEMLRVKTNPVLLREMHSLLKSFLQVQDIEEILKLNFSNDPERQLIDMIGASLSGKLLYIPGVYDSVRESFIKPLVEAFLNTDKFDFILEERTPDYKKLVFYTLFLCVFSQDDRELQTQLVASEKFMQNLPPLYFKLIFAVIASKPLSLGYTNDLLVSMKRYFENEDLRDLRDITPEEMRNHDFFKQVQPNIIRYNVPKVIYTINNEVVSVHSALPYLIKCKRYEVFHSYVEEMEITNPEVFTILILAYDNQDLLNLISKIDLDVQSQYPRLLLWLLEHTNDECVRQMNLRYDNQLIKYEISHMKNLPEDRQNDSLLHDLIYMKLQDKVEIVKGMATQQEWEFLKSFKSPLIQIQVQDEDKVSPFYVALSNAQYKLAKLLIPEEGQLKAMTKSEKEIIKQFLLSSNIITYGNYDRQHALNLQEFQEFALGNRKPKMIPNSQNRANPKRIQDFQFVKKLIIFPQILKIIHLSARHDQIQDEYNFFQIAKEQIKKEIGQKVEIDTFIVKCGFPLDSQKVFYNSSYSEEQNLYFIENGFDLTEYFKSLGPFIDSQMVKHPYSWFKNAGIFNQGKWSATIVKAFESEEIKEILNLLKEIILEKQKDLLSNEYFSREALTTYFKNGFLAANFAVSYFLLNVQLLYKIIDVKDFELFNDQHWNLHNKTLSHDLVLLSLLRRLQPLETLFKATVFLKADYLPGSDFLLQRKQDNDYVPIQFNFNSRQLALLISMFNGFTKYEIKVNSKDESEKDERKACIKGFLIASQSYFNQVKLTKSQQKERKNIKKFKAVINQMKLVKEAIEQYETAFNGNKPEYTNLAEQLNFRLDHTTFNNNSLTDQDFHTILIELLDLKTKTFEDDFKMTFDFDPVHLPSKNHLNGRKYPMTERLCDFFITQLQPFLNQIAEQITYQETLIKFKFTQQSKFEVTYVDELNAKVDKDKGRVHEYQCIIGFNHFDEEDSASRVIKGILEYQHRQMIQEYIDDSVEQFRSNLQVKEVLTENLDHIQNLSIEEATKAATIIKNNSQTLWDLVSNKISQYVNIKKFNEWIKFNQIVVSFIKNKNELLEDQKHNYDMYLNSAQEARSAKDLEIKVNFAFDLEGETILINEAAFHPLALVSNRQLLLEFQNWPLMHSFDNDYPELNIDLVSLYRNVLKTIPGLQNPLINAKALLQSNIAFQTLYTETLDTFVAYHSHEIPDKTSAYQASVYYEIRDIQIEFELDEINCEDSKLNDAYQNGTAGKSQPNYSVIATRVKCETMNIEESPVENDEQDQEDNKENTKVAEKVEDQQSSSSKKEMNKKWQELMYPDKKKKAKNQNEKEINFPSNRHSKRGIIKFFMSAYRSDQ